MSKNEQDLIILSHLQAHKELPKLFSAYSEFTDSDVRRERRKKMDREKIVYYFAKLPVCREFFFMVHDLGIKRYKHYNHQKIKPREHGSKGKILKNIEALSADDVEKVVSFITKYAEKYALPLPGRVVNFKDYQVVLLPSTNSKASLHRLYSSGLSDADAKIVGLRSFYNIWKQYCPNIIVMKPASDLCEICKQNVDKIIRNSNCSDVAKSQAIAEAQLHLLRAQRQRENYNKWRKLVRENDTIEIDGIKRKVAVLSFDYAEQVHYPSSARAVGSTYFKTARKCGIFGVHDEKTGIQRNYLIDEADDIGKGPNSVVSMLYQYFSTINAEVIILFADNCAAQNKNNTISQYLSWCVLSKLNVRIEFNFLLAGHTKFAPDRNFGILKYAYSRSNVDCLEEQIDCVNKSSHKGFNEAMPTFLNGMRNVNWSAWTEFLSGYFRTFPGISKYHQFIYYPDGKMQTRLFIDSNPETCVLQTSTLETTEALMIEEIIPQPMTIDRQWYLFENIRELCTKPENKDKVAPKPLVSKSKHKPKSNSDQKQGDKSDSQPPVEDAKSTRNVFKKPKPLEPLPVKTQEPKKRGRKPKAKE